MPIRRFWTFYAWSWAIVLAVVIVRVALPTPFWQTVTEAQQAHGSSDLYLGSLLRMSVSHPITSLILIYAVAPTLVALISLLGRGRRAELRRWLGRLRPVGETTMQRAALGYATLLAGFFLLVPSFAFISTQLGTREGGFLERGLSGNAVTTSMARGLLLDEGAVLEEMGWRGYAYPLLVASGRSPAGACFTLGALWGIWHIPSQLSSPFYRPDRTFLLFQLLFVLYSIALTILCVLLMNWTGGSIWPAIFTHGLANYASISTDDLTLGVHTGFLIKTAILVAIAAGAALITRGRLCSSPPTEPASASP